MPGIENVGLFHIVGQPNLEIQIDRAGLRPLRDQRGRRRGGRPGGHRRPGVLADGRGGEALRHRPPAAAGPARRPRRHRPDPGRRPRRRTASRARGSPSRSWPRSIPHKPGASYIYRENNRRYIPIKFSVRGRDLASAIDEAQQQGRRPQDRGASSPRATGSSGRASSPRCRRPTRG